MADAASQLRFYSVGIAAANLDLKSDVLEVYCQEDHPMANGEITDNANTYKSEGEGEDAGAYQVEMKTSISIPCKWMPLGEPNRQTPPNIRRGEEVIVLTFGDSQQYYWVSRNNDLLKRKLETVVWAFSGTPEEGANVQGGNVYFLEVSTHKKLVRLVTSVSNKEAARYNIELNTGKGTFTIEDDASNRLFFGTKDKTFSYENAVGALLQILGKSMKIVMPESIEIDTKSWKVNGKEAVEKFTTMMMEAETTHKGNFGLQGGLSAKGGAGGGNATFDYPAEFKQGIKVNGDATISGSLTAQRVTSIDPISAPNV